MPSRRRDRTRRFLSLRHPCALSPGESRGSTLTNTLTTLTKLDAVPQMQFVLWVWGFLLTFLPGNSRRSAPRVTMKPLSSPGSSG